MLENLDTLALGSAFLGASPDDYLQQIIKLQKTEPAGLIQVDGLNPEDLIVPIGFYGNRLIAKEKLPNKRQFEVMINTIQERYQKKITAFCALDNANALLPLYLASLYSLPILDGNLAGRKLSELHMLSTNFFGMYPEKSFITNDRGHVFEITCNNFYDIARYIDYITTASGQQALIVPQVLTGAQAKTSIIPGTFTQAFKIGQIIEQTKDINKLAAHVKGKLVGIGKITKNDKTIEIKNEDTIFRIENSTTLYKNDELINEMPDMIVVCNAQTASPIHNEINIEVGIIVMKSADIWYTAKGQSIVAPLRRNA